MDAIEWAEFGLEDSPAQGQDLPYWGNRYTALVRALWPRAEQIDRFGDRKADVDLTHPANSPLGTS